MHIFKHFAMILRHKRYVFIHCCKVGLIWQGIMHDMSKFSPTEFFTSAKYYTGTGSPITEERKENGYSKVWMHHSKRNKHHIEYWYDFAPKVGGLIYVKMPVRYLAEMYCDMLAANKAYRGKDHKDTDAIAYFHLQRMAERMHPETAAALEKLFTILAESGEDAAFAYIRKLLKQKDY